MASVELSHINKVYKGNVYAVKDFNLTIADKEFIILVGPSGCGKSTTLRMIAGLEDISEGTIKIGDRIINDIDPKDRDIAMVFQNYALYPHMTVFENMAFGLKLRKISKEVIEQKVAEAAKILDIEHLLKRKPKALSGGQRQRVALGRAIVRDPNVFLMDEPLSNLDAKLRVQMRTEISKLHQRLQTTFIYVTHDQTEAMTMGDRIVVMKDGLIQQVNAPQEIYEHPANMFVAGFIGSPQINFLKGRVVPQGDQLALQYGEVLIPLTREKSDLLKNHDLSGKEVIIGVRPEAIGCEPEFLEQHASTVFPVMAEVTEIMGAESYLYFKHGENAITARVNGNTRIRPGETVQIALNESKVHVFDPDTEETYF
ncbi:sn-glycerol-3-phosphate ABC transporter ATP-binding protein UgpC [Clostridiaceae bacterium HFYG-1003]|nr:sn-glycerol-3-phosphate ABC transporter ATP-binding protein UgpC [Clostridiaceae bacterium HFYG-1003]